MNKSLNLRRRELVLGTTLSAAGVFPRGVQAQPWQGGRPVKIIVPFPAGNTIDVLTRLIQPRLAEELGRAVVIENVSGAGGRIGMAAIARANPDGHTVGAVQGGLMIVQPHTFKELPYDVLNDFIPVAVSVWNYNVLAASKGAPFANVREMISWAAANPGKLMVGTNGEGGFPHLWFEDFSRRANFKFTHVPFRGAAELGTALIGEQLMVAADSMPGFQALIQADKIRLLATTNGTRVPEAPDAPTLNDFYPGFVRNGWFGYVVPAKTSPNVVVRLNAAVNKIINEPEVIKRLRTFSLTPDAKSPDFFAKLIKEDYDRFGAIVKAMDLKPQ